MSHNAPYVPPVDAQRMLQELLEANKKLGPIAIQSLEGPVGVGKTSLVENTIQPELLKRRKFLRLVTKGKINASTTDVVLDLISSTPKTICKPGEELKLFPNFARLMKWYVIHVRKLQEGKQGGKEKLAEGDTVAQVLTVAKELSETFPALKKVVNFEHLLKHQGSISASLSLLDKLEYWFRSREIGPNTSQPTRAIADALTKDLTRLLAADRPSGGASAVKIAEFDRLFLFVDDYEVLQPALESLLLEHLLVRLADAPFETILLVVGRDKLEYTNRLWGQRHNLKMVPTISLHPLDRSQMNELLGYHGLSDSVVLDTAWKETRGLPIFVNLWIEEHKRGGPSAAGTQSLYERITAWMSDKQKEWTEKVSFLNEVNEDTLEILFGDPGEAKEAMAWFQKEATLRDPAAEPFRVYDFLRSRISKHVRNISPKRYNQLLAAAESANNALAAQTDTPVANVVKSKRSRP